LAFLVLVDAPMYLQQWHADLQNGRELLGVLDGLRDISNRRVVTREFVLWREEIPWMSLYFSLAVWSSIVLCGAHLLKVRLPRYPTGLPRWRPADLPPARGALRRCRTSAPFR
jgi:hypothetical protein